MSDGPFYYSVSQIGIFGLIGLVGALVAQRTGIFHDRGLSIPVTGISIILIALSLVVGTFYSNSILAIIIVIIILDVATQSALVLGQTRLFNLPVTERSRLNTAFVVGNFIGGAIGSIISEPIWESSGWIRIMSTGFALNVLALLISLYNRLRSFSNLRWTYVTPAFELDIDGARTGKYIIGGEEYFTNEKGKSYISYADFAVAFIEIIENDYVRKRVSVIGE